VRIRLSEPARLRLQVRHGTTVLASRVTRLSGGTTHELHLKLNRRGKRMLRRHRTLRVTLFAVARDAANNTGTASKAARIHR
jgi:hypothetical protein